MVYDVILKRHCGSSRSNVCIFYDEDREVTIKEMQRYNKKHGFSIDEKDGTFTIADIILRERKPTGEVISETPYIELFDGSGNRRKWGVKDKKVL